MLRLLQDDAGQENELNTILKSQDLFSTNFDFKHVLFGHFARMMMTVFLLIILFSRVNI